MSSLNTYKKYIYVKSKLVVLVNVIKKMAIIRRNGAKTFYIYKWAQKARHLPGRNSPLYHWQQYQMSHTKLNKGKRYGQPRWQDNNQIQTTAMRSDPRRFVFSATMLLRLEATFSSFVQLLSDWGRNLRATTTQNFRKLEQIFLIDHCNGRVCRPISTS